MAIIRGKIWRTAREDALHDQIQAAMNWKPGMFRLCEDGVYRNADGEEAVSMTLDELLAEVKKDK